MSGDAHVFNNIETRVVIIFFPERQGGEGNSHYSDRPLACFLPRWAKDLSGTLITQCH